MKGAPVGDRKRHPIFARFFNRLSRGMERELGPQRERLLDGLRGRVLEVGAGNGMNFSHYPASVAEVVALEPEPYLRAKALEAAARATVPVRVLDGVAAPLPFGPATFDAAVASLVLCTVPDPAGALTEMGRVVKRDGELRFLEHVRAPGPPKASVQTLLDRTRLWPLLGGGCHCSRDTAATIAAAGFRIHELETVVFSPAWDITNPHVRGVARVA
jgi:ubiquinone/menaquinone biosynthesis C-methylase UbiE